MVHSVMVPEVAGEPVDRTLIKLQLAEEASGALRVATVRAALLREDIDRVTISVANAKEVGPRRHGPNLTPLQADR
jgi:hypothetical protein